MLLVCNNFIKNLDFPKSSTSTSTKNNTGKLEAEKNNIPNEK
jgi:hypothetical protein